MELPVIDVSAWLQAPDVDVALPAAIDAACREHGFFHVTGHGIDPELVARLDGLSRRFFALPAEHKAEIDMRHGGRAWRGWFPVGREQTLGRPDQKEGLYFGAELGPEDPRCAGRALHGPNQFPDVERYPALEGLRATVLAYLDALARLGEALCRGISLGLGLPADALARRGVADPTLLLRVFRYPALAPNSDAWSVAEHTDYGLLTLLAQDDTGGLEVHTRAGWTAVAPRPADFVCNLGDMLERMTGGRYLSTPHRVRNPSRRERISTAFFFDPAFDAPLSGLDLGLDPGLDPELGAAPVGEASERWDGRSVHAFEGTYGDYLVDKVRRVFPDLARDVLG